MQHCVVQLVEIFLFLIILDWSICQICYKGAHLQFGSLWAWNDVKKAVKQKSGHTQ